MRCVVLIGECIARYDIGSRYMFFIWLIVDHEYYDAIWFMEL